MNDEQLVASNTSMWASHLILRAKITHDGLNAELAGTGTRILIQVVRLVEDVGLIGPSAGRSEENINPKILVALERLKVMGVTQSSILTAAPILNRIHQILKRPSSPFPNTVYNGAGAGNSPN